MGKYTFLNVLAFTIIALAVAMFLLPGKPPEQAHQLPWQIETTAEGSIRVFGLTLGHSRLMDAEHVASELAEVSLFSSDDQGHVIEAYINTLILNGLKAKMVFNLDLSDEMLQGMYERGSRIATMGSGTRKVTLSSGDQQLIRQAVINGITYIPQINLDEALITKRFGQPQQRIREAESGTVHWLYPDKGLDLAYHAEAKEVLQYLPPKDFDRLMQPLLAQGERLN